MKRKHITTILLLSIWAPTLTLYAEPSSGETVQVVQVQETTMSLTRQANRIRQELQNAEGRLQAFSDESLVDRNEWLQAYSERIIELKKSYVERVEQDYAGQKDSEETEKIKHLIDHLQTQRAELMKKEHEYRLVEREVARLKKLYDLVFNRLKEMDIPAANKQSKATVDTAP